MAGLLDKLRDGAPVLTGGASRTDDSSPVARAVQAKAPGPRLLDKLRDGAPVVTGGANRDEDRSPIVRAVQAKAPGTGLLNKLRDGTQVLTGGASRTTELSPVVRAVRAAATGLSLGLTVMATPAMADGVSYMAALPTVAPLSVTALAVTPGGGTALERDVAAIQAKAPTTANGTPVVFVTPDTFMAAAVASVVPDSAGAKPEAVRRLDVVFGDGMGAYNTGISALAKAGAHANTRNDGLTHKGDGSDAACVIAVDGSMGKQRALGLFSGLSDPELVSYAKIDSKSIFSMTYWHEFGHCTSTSRIANAENMALNTLMQDFTAAGLNKAGISPERIREEAATLRTVAEKMVASSDTDMRLRGRMLDAMATTLDRNPQLGAMNSFGILPDDFRKTVNGYTRHLQESTADAYSAIRSAKEGVPAADIDRWKAMRVMGVFANDGLPKPVADNMKLGVEPRAAYNTAPAIDAARRLAAAGSLDAKGMEEAAIAATASAATPMDGLLALSDQVRHRAPAADRMPELNAAVKLVTDGRSDAATFISTASEDRNVEYEAPVVNGVASVSPTPFADAKVETSENELSPELAPEVARLRQEIIKRGGTTQDVIDVTTKAKDVARDDLWGAEPPADAETDYARLKAADIILKAAAPASAQETAPEVKAPGIAPATPTEAAPHKAPRVAPTLTLHGIENDGEGPLVVLAHNGVPSRPMRLDAFEKLAAKNPKLHAMAPEVASAVADAAAGLKSDGTPGQRR